jgi:hypothetical protein
VVLNASTFQVGLLSAATTISFLLIALPAGAVVDRMAKRRLMIGCDTARMLIIGSVPAAAAFGLLTLAQLYVVAVAAGVLTVFFDVAYQSYTLTLISRDQLMDGNGKLAATQSFSQVAGPGLGGTLFGLLRAGAMTADAASYAVSAASLLLIRSREPVQARPHGPARARLRTEIFAGLAFVLRQPVLRKIAACTATWNLFGAMASALGIIFLIRLLHVRPADAGLLLAAGSLGGVAAGVSSGWVARDRVGPHDLVRPPGLRRHRSGDSRRRTRLAARAVPGRPGRLVIFRRAVQHRTAQLPADDLPAGAARADELGGALDRLGNAAARWPARRRTGLGARSPAHALDRGRRMLRRRAVGAVLAAAPHARRSRASSARCRRGAGTARRNA